VSRQTLSVAGLPVLSGWSAAAAAGVAILILFGWQLASLRAVQRGDFIDDSKLRLKSAGPQEVGMGLEQVAGLHLFGDVAANVVAPPPTTNLPKTDLKLVLVGAMTDSDPKKASALIQADNQTRRFYVGDNIPGGAVLHEVLSDSVVLQRDNRYETLFFPRAGDGPAPARPRVGAGSPLGQAGSISPGGAVPSGEKNIPLHDRR
jgi:general secretion pathway protein C